MVSGRSRQAAAYRRGHHYQQRDAHADRDRGGDAAQREAGHGRSAHRGGESATGFRPTQGEHRQPAGEQDRCQRPTSGHGPARVPRPRRQQQHRPVPQIPRVRHPADRPHRRQCQHAAAPLRPVRRSRRRSPARRPHRATAPQCPDTAWSAPNRVQANRISASPAHPVIAADSAGSRRHRPAVRATRPPAANCQARVGSEKNATAVATRVSNSDSGERRGRDQRKDHQIRAFRGSWHRP